MNDLLFNEDKNRQTSFGWTTGVSSTAVAMFIFLKNRSRNIPNETHHQYRSIENKDRKWEILFEVIETNNDWDDTFRE